MVVASRELVKFKHTVTGQRTAAESVNGRASVGNLIDDLVFGRESGRFSKLWIWFGSVANKQIVNQKSTAYPSLPGLDAPSNLNMLSIATTLSHGFYIPRPRYFSPQLYYAPITNPIRFQLTAVPVQVALKGILSVQHTSSNLSQEGRPGHTRPPPSESLPYTGLLHRPCTSMPASSISPRCLAYSK